MATQPDLPNFSYNLRDAGKPAAPAAPAAPRYITPPAPTVPNVTPGGLITLREFAAGGARPNMYGLYDPRGAANLSSAMPYQAMQTGRLDLGPNAPRALGYGSWDSKTGYSPQPLDRVARPYTPGQYGGRMAVPPAAAPPAAVPPAAAPPAAVPPAAAPAPTGGNSALAVRPNAAPANVPPTAPAMKAADVLNVRTIPGTGGVAGAAAVPALEAGAAGGGGAAAGIGSKIAGAASMVGRALPVVGDAIQGAMYGYETGSVGRGLAAGLGSLGGRLAGGAGGTLVAPGIGTAAGSIAGSLGGAAGGAALYDTLMGDTLASQSPPAVTEANKSMNLPTPAENQEYFRQKASETRATDPRKAAAFDLTAARATDPRQAEPETRAAAKEVAKYGEFQGPSAEEKARFRKQTGTPYDPKSITDKLNLERMRAGEQTFTSKQSREFRQANPEYRPGRYAQQGKTNYEYAGMAQARGIKPQR